MELDKQKAVIEAILFAAGREIKINELMAILEISSDEVISIINSLQEEYAQPNRGIEIIKVEDGYQLATKKDMYEYLYPIFDKRSKPNLSQASMETLAIIAYNPKITRAEIEAIRGVNSDGTIYKLLEYNLIENVGKADLPGRPTMYSTTQNFLKMFGITSLEELPDLPRYKLDENQQIVIDDILEAPMPERENLEESN
ncbi:MAG: SMC-Scp complex subunit ScpB [Clostridia bacterium]